MRFVLPGAIGAAIAGAARPPGTWLSCSTATLHDPRAVRRPTDAQTEIRGADAPGAPGTYRFGIDAAKARKRTLAAASSPTTRMLNAGAVLMRTEPEPIRKSRRALAALRLERDLPVELAPWPATACRRWDDRLRAAR